MWLFQAKPEFITVLKEESVKPGDNVTLECKVNTEKVTVTWKKNDKELRCVHGKHTVEKHGTTLRLEILNFQEDDVGTYTVEVTNSWGSISCFTNISFDLKDWRNMPPPQEKLLKSLREYAISEKVSELRILLHGPIGAGKSSIINTINSIFQDRLFINCLTATCFDESFTQNYEKFSIGSERSGFLPFVFYDVMGIEEGEKDGVHPDDIISALKGHIPDGYKFQFTPMVKDNKYFITNPTLKNQIHCLVSVVQADRTKLMNVKVINKMKDVRKAASDLGIPQMVLMTKVDQACSLTKYDLSKIYQSKKIREKVQECSNRLGVPENCIFPVKNYHNEVELKEDINRLMLAALAQIVFSANDYVERHSA